MINGKLTIDLVREIIKHELDIEDERINIYNQKWKIPPDDELFVVLEYRGTPKIISSRNYYSEVNDTESQDLNTQESIIIGLFSRNLEAIQRKEEAVMALYSIYSQQIQEANSFKIMRGASIEDLSDLEGAARLYRFDIPIIVFAWYHKTKASEYYDSFDAQVLVDEGEEEAEEINFDQPVESPTSYPI